MTTGERNKATGAICEWCGQFVYDDEAAGLPPRCTGECIPPLADDERGDR